MCDKIDSLIHLRPLRFVYNGDKTVLGLEADLLGHAHLAPTLVIFSLVARVSQNEG
jgi:hypothetical protein